MLAREILLVERLADERFDHSLATDVQLLRGPSSSSNMPGARSTFTR